LDLECRELVSASTGRIGGPHKATAFGSGMPSSWQRLDAFYDFRLRKDNKGIMISESKPEVLDSESVQLELEEDIFAIQ
jgi:hypothetical protein